MLRNVFLLAPLKTLLGVVFALWCLGSQAWAAATTLAVGGTVSVTPKSGAAGPLAEGQRVETGSSIKTGLNSNTTLRFDDGQLVALSANTTYTIDDYRFNAHKPAEGTFVSTLVQGGMRSVTGLLGKLNPGEVKVKATVATVGIRGTDYQLFLDSRLNVHVLDGTIVVSNRGGEELFSKDVQPTGIVADLLSKPRPVLFTELPVDAQASFRQLETNPFINTRQPNPNDPSCSDRR
jgi:hypothetical protein